MGIGILVSILVAIYLFYSLFILPIPVVLLRS